MSPELRWLIDCLQALARQTYQPLAVLAVDNGSTDGSRELLQQALGEKRVLSLGEDAGVAGSVRAALELSAAREADYLLITHDDAALQLARERQERLVLERGHRQAVTLELFPVQLGGLAMA